MGSALRFSLAAHGHRRTDSAAPWAFAARKQGGAISDRPWPWGGNEGGFALFIGCAWASAIGPFFAKATMGEIPPLLGLRILASRLAWGKRQQAAAVQGRGLRFSIFHPRSTMPLFQVIVFSLAVPSPVGKLVSCRWAVGCGRVVRAGVDFPFQPFIQPTQMLFSMLASRWNQLCENTKIDTHSGWTAIATAYGDPVRAFYKLPYQTQAAAR